MTDWRLPANRREAFQRFYTFHLRYRAHPGCVYSLLPAIAKHYDMDADQRAWLVWLNGNTQNPVTSLLLFEAAPRPERWRDAVIFWNDNWSELEWDMDRRYQKAKFGEATEKLMSQLHRLDYTLEQTWSSAASGGWGATWAFALAHPYMGRLAAWSMTEYARILLPNIPDAETLMLGDKSGSRSHRNGLAVIAGYDAAYWPAEAADTLGIVPELTELGEDLLAEACERNPGNVDVSRLTLESALCTYKSWHKPNRRYPGVYVDMAYERLVRATNRWKGERFDILWRERAKLPHWMLVEQGAEPLSKAKQNHYLETGQIPLLWRQWPDMEETRW